MSDVFEDRAGRIVAAAFTNNLRGRITGDDVITNALLARSELMSALLDPRRDVDDECHYPKTLDIAPEEYKQLYDRDAIACRVVQCIAKESWQVTPEIFESEDPDVTTPFEEAWDALQPMNTGASWYKEEQSGSVWEYLMRADILSGIGHFGVLLMGFDDGRNLQEPVEGSTVTNTYWPSVPGETYNQHIPDCYLTNAEEVCLLALKDLTEQEKMTINQLVRQREMVLNRMARQEDRKNGKPALFGDSTGLQQTGEGLEGTDKQYSQGFGLQGEANYEPSPMGTDQQYFGVQFGPTEQPSKEVSKRKTRLLFLRPFDESLVQVVRYEWNINNPRFGMPVMYRITLNDPREHHTGVGLPMATVFVHWSRVIHLSDNLNSSEIFGAPRMRPVLNRLLDLQKIYGASAEGYWQAAFTGIALTTHPQLGGDVTIDAADLKNQVENYINSMQRWLALTGMSAQTLAPQVSDPTSQIAGHLEAICIQLGIPVRIFKGSERGELASSQDDASWNDRLKARQNGYITPRIIVPFVDRLIAVGVLPEPTYVEPEDEPAFEEYGAEEAGFGGMDFDYDYPDVEFDDFAGGQGDEQGLAEEEDGEDAEDGDGQGDDEPRGADPDAGEGLAEGADEKDGDGEDDEDRTPAGLTKNAFEESKHPRAEDGRFGEEGGIKQSIGKSAGGWVVEASMPDGTLVRYGRTKSPARGGANELWIEVGDKRTTYPLKTPGPFEIKEARFHKRLAKLGITNPLGKRDLTENADGPAGAVIKKGYTVVWPDLDSNTDKDKAMIAATKTQALAAYVAGNVEAVMPLMEFYTTILGMSDEEAGPLVQAAEAQQREMEEQQASQQAAMGGLPPGMGGIPGQEPGGPQASPGGPQQGLGQFDLGEIDQGAEADMNDWE